MHSFKTVLGKRPFPIAEDWALVYDIGFGRRVRGIFFAKPRVFRFRIFLKICLRVWPCQGCSSVCSAMKALANDFFDGILTSECHDCGEEEKSEKSDKDNPSACFSNSTTQHARISCWGV